MSSTPYMIVRVLFKVMQPTLSDSIIVYMNDMSTITGFGKIFLITSLYG